MRKNKLIIINKPRLYSRGDGMDLSALQGMAGSSSGVAGLQELFKAIDSQVQNTTDIAKMFIPKQEDPHLVSRRALRGYDLGGALQLADVATQQVAQGVGYINDVNDKAKTVKEDIKEHVTNPSPSSSTEELLNKWSLWNPTAHIGWKDLTNKGSALSFGTDMLTMSSQGAMAGASLGIPGAILGGVGGLVTGAFGNLAAGIRARKQKKKINKMIDAQNLSTQRAFSNQAEQLDNEMVTRELSDFTGWPAAYGGPLFANGGMIHIDPKNRGKFTETKKRTGKTTEELTHSSNPLTRKRAIFAQNAKKWHHAFGGELNTQGGDFTNGLLYIGNGGSHESNPNEGVQLGVDSEGIPNLVEEGEVIFNDYVFSKRLKVPKEVRKKYKLRGTKPLTFADAAIQMSKESQERPNDPISQAGLENGMLKLMIAQEQVRKRHKGNKFAKGGKIGRIYEGTGDLPQQLLLNDTPLLMGDIEDTSWMKKLNLPEDDIKQSDWWKEKIEPVGTAPIDPATTIASSGDQTSYLDKKDIPLTTIENLDGTKAAVKESQRREKAKGKSNTGMDYLRFAPAVSQGIQTLTDALGLTNRPDFTLGRRIREANRQVKGIGTRAAGQRIGYKPTDMWAAINNFNSQMAAQRAAIRNAGNRVGAAGQLLASAYNQNRALGQLYAGMEKANWDRLTHAIAHNTSVDQNNRNAELQAAQADAAQGNIRANNLIAAAKADDAEESAYAQARATNRDNFFNTLGALGKEKIDRNMMEGLLEAGIFGTQNQSMLEALGYLGIKPKQKAAKGGKIKRKKGLTY